MTNMRPFISRRIISAHFEFRAWRRRSLWIVVFGKACAHVRHGKAAVFARRQLEPVGGSFIEVRNELIVCLIGTLVRRSMQLPEILETRYSVE